jgi:rhodanese-related sulfurtransferase
VSDGKRDGVRPITPEAAWRLLEGGAAAVVDVREGAEVAATGKIPGALLIPVGSIESRADRSSPAHNPKLMTDRDVILYCASGSRAARAGRILTELGYSRVYNLGGIKDWIAAGLPVDMP